MKCENCFCAYWEKEDECVLDEVELDISGSCKSCIYISMEESELKKAREKTLNGFGD